MGRVEAVCISEKKGTVKKDIGQCDIIEDLGLKDDAHAGSIRQVSLLSSESVVAFKARAGQKGQKPDILPGAFGENLLVSGIDPAAFSPGTVLKTGDILLEITQIGKECHSGCEIMKQTGECIMPKQGAFAKVLKGGTVKSGDEIIRPFTAAVITSSDRSYNGEREDMSGPLIKEILERNDYFVREMILLPDDEDRMMNELIRTADEVCPNVIFTTGGTGFSARDRVPEATLRAADRMAPGIAEAVRAYSMQITPRAMLSRAVSVIRGETLIINLPGSPRAVKECLEFLLPGLSHGILILRGEADG